MTKINYDDLMTTKCDVKFKAVKELKWDPWVGKDYCKTSILFLGKSAYCNFDEDENPKNPSRFKEGTEKRTMNRTLIKENIEKNKHTPHQNTAKIFFEALDKKTNHENRQTFWASVAFANYAQDIVKNSKGKTLNRKKCNTAFNRVVEIIKPELVVIWSTVLWDFGLDRKDAKKHKKIDRAIPRVIKAKNGKPAYIGILHPSWWNSRSPSEWHKFLADEPASKDAIAKLTSYLETKLK